MMNKSLLLLLLPLWLLGCSAAEKQPSSARPAAAFSNGQSGYAASNSAPAIRIRPDEAMAVSHAQVLQAYERFLSISDDAEVRVRVHQRMAALKLQQQELQQDGLLPPSATTRAEPEPAAAIRDYEALLQQFPERADNDSVRYQLARASLLNGQPQKAMAALEDLIRLHPQSAYVTESHFRLGQLYYNSGDYELAAAAYQQVVAAGRAGNPYYVSAGYLRGWALFRHQHYDDSLLAFTRVLDEEFPDAARLEAASGGDLALRDDILRAMALIVTEAGDWEMIARFYNQHGVRHYEYLLYDRLASLYYQRGFHRSAASTLRAYVLRYPLDRRAPGYYERLIEGYRKAGYASLNRRHKAYYNDLFGVGSAFWQQHADAAMRTALTSSLSTYLHDLAGFHHGLAQQSRKAGTRTRELQTARRWYEEIVRSFPQAEDIARDHFLLAEVAFELQDFVAARDHYETVAYQYPADEQAAEAGYAAILAYNRHRPEPPQAAAWRQATIASAMRFVQQFAQDPRSGTVLVNTAEMLLQDEQYEQALATARMADTVEQNLSPRYRYGAALVRGHASFALGQFAEAEQALQLALQQQQAKPAQVQELREKIAASIYQQGLHSREQGDALAAVQHWLRLASVIPESRSRIAAEYDAATLLMAIPDYPQAVQVLQQFRQQYPQHPLTADIPSKLIVAYEEQQDWAAAAAELEYLCRHHSNPQQQRIACYQTAQYYQRGGDDAKALLAYRHYAHQFPQPLDAALEAHYQLDQLYAAAGEENKRQFWLNKIIVLHNKAGAEQTDRSRYLAASAAFQLGEAERLRYEKIRLSQPLAASIQRKNAALQAAQKRYTQAAKLEVQEFTTAATFRLGQLYAGMSKALMSSERPAGLDELEQEEYQYLLEEQAFPLDEAAIEIHQTNAGRTRDGLYDNWVRESFSALSGLMPGQYNKQEKVAAYVDAIR
ncbi:tetratricopeptide repeat protein [Oceanospirillaceae bacterium ASx5O]|nr:tetratricopeptide repeat protein [Oceanospirillaceae bacterium ASx5O]